MERMGRKTMALAALMLACSAQAKGPVKVSGAVYTGATQEHPVIITLLGERGDTLELYEALDGRFRLRLPAERQLTLRFSGNGSLDKDVLIDTRHALDSGPRARKVDFDVRLEVAPECPAPNNGAAGRIAFIPGTSLLKVLHHDPVVNEL